MYGRKITDGLRKGTPLHLYLPGPHRGVWNGAALTASRELILCESLIDAMTFWCAGYRNVTASYGVEGFTDDHLAAFQAHGTQRVLIAYDRDDAGERAADKLAERLIGAGIECYRIQFPKGMDANEYALKVQPAAKSLGALIRKAVWMGNGEAPAAPTSPAAVVPVTVPSLAAKEEAAPLPPPTPLPASPAPAGPSFALDADVRDNEVVLAFAERRYRVRGLSKNLAYDVLKVNCWRRTATPSTSTPSTCTTPGRGPATSHRQPLNCGWPKTRSRRTWGACCSSSKRCRSCRFRAP